MVILLYLFILNNVCIKLQKYIQRRGFCSRSFSFEKVSSENIEMKYVFF